MAGVAPMPAGAVATNLVDSVEIAADTNIVVAAGDTLKIEYLWSADSVVVTKSGGGVLVLATVGGDVSLDVAEGTLKSARPSFAASEGAEPIMRLDASEAATLTVSASGGTNFVTQWTDADGRTSNKASSWSGYGKPFVTDETLNGLALVDFGTFKDSNHAGHGGMLGVSPNISAREWFYVWEDREETKDLDLVSGATFSGPQVLGANTDWTRGLGGGGEYFNLRTSGAPGRCTENLRLDGATAKYNTKPSAGFHVLNNHITDGKNAVTLGTIGYGSSGGRNGGMRLAEVVVYTNALSDAMRSRTEAYLSSKWFGAELAAVTLRDGAALDVSAVKFRIGTFCVEGMASLRGASNLVFDASSSSPTSTLAIAEEAYALPDKSLGTMPAASFTGTAHVAVAEGTNTLEAVASSAGSLVKTGEGVLNVAFPDSGLNAIVVSNGTLSISALYERTSEYHMDASAPSSIDTTAYGTTNLVSVWRDLNDSTRTLKPTTWRKPDFDTSRLLRAPYLVEDAANGLPMVDFGTFADANHTDGWGGELAPSTQFNDSDGFHAVLAVWRDDPDVKNYSGATDGSTLYGPSLFAAQYYWYRGLGGNGNSFPMHYANVSARMYGGTFRIDGAARSATTYRVGDGVHVLAQEITSTGAPFTELGGNFQVPVTTGGGTVNGVFGGLSMGEVMIFKDCPALEAMLSIEGELMAKWQGATNERHFASIDVAEGATLSYPYADLVVTNLSLGGTIAAKSVRPVAFAAATDGATIDGALVLDGGTFTAVADGEGGFNCVSASSVVLSRGGVLAFAEAPSSSLVGSEFKVVDSSVVEATAARWKCPAELPGGMKASLVAKEDGLYVKFVPGGFIVICW